MAVEHFVIIAGLPKTPGYGAEVSLISSSSKAQAHALAVDTYRKNYKLASNVHVQTYTAFSSDSEAEASAFMLRLMEEERKRNAAKQSSE